MKKILKYHIVSNSYVLEANSEINRYIKLGYQPYGALITDTRKHLTYTEISYTQVMVLYEADAKGVETNI